MDKENSSLNLEQLGFLLLSFFFNREIKLPEGFKEIYEKYLDENGNIINQEEFIKEEKPVIVDYFSKSKEEFINNYE